ncbi:hypothetical protein [Stratiformator vulcanicus]|uniref:Glycoside hydrolase family 5 domain-containing protein n=1 Tax=Stratiformator vulcanicus TaxID=2527980 RepID=A0A517QY80_9PLAN|nr:hypothetical protein [Stratiformator vulcanicus]QDT36567.1 hypothetical protein Pan189_09270 [Stratiformator vulcanicus]
MNYALRSLASALFATSVALFLAVTASGEESFVEYQYDWNNTAGSVTDMSHYLDAPAGKNGFIRVDGDDLATPDGSRFRIWGMNVGGNECFPSHEDAAGFAGDLARMGVNVVRFHHLDSKREKSTIDYSKGDSRHLDLNDLDKLDFYIAELKKRGVYTNLNLNVSRRFMPGDDVPGWNEIGIAKGATLYDDRLIELQMEYARNLLTHENPYTGMRYCDDPAVAVVELVNENSMFESWWQGRLSGSSDRAGFMGDTWAPLPKAMTDVLDNKYNKWLKDNLKQEQLAELQIEVDAALDGRIPRLEPSEFAAASKLRFHSELKFLMELEAEYFERMRKLLRDEIGLKCLIVGSADHNDWISPFPIVKNLLMFDIVDGHGYWHHPQLGTPTWFGMHYPMVNDPLDSSFVQFSRTPVHGKPFVSSETNEPFPHRFTAENFPIVAAYGLLNDWDGIYWFAWGDGREAKPEEGLPTNRWFDVANDPVKMTNLAALAPMWYRGDVREAETEIVREMTDEVMLESARLDRKNFRPFFTPDFALSTPLRHRVSWKVGDKTATEFPAAIPVLDHIPSDTGELNWDNVDKRAGIVSINTPKTQGLVGFVKGSGIDTPVLKHELETPFCSLILTSLDGKRLSKSSRILLAACDWATNTDFEWSVDKNVVKNWGKGPTVITPVKGRIYLADGFAGVSENAIQVTPLTPEGREGGTTLKVTLKDPQSPSSAKRREGLPSFEIGDPATTWYLIEVKRPE